MTPTVFFRKAVTLPILLYQKLISPLVRGSCIYDPTCSSYARDAVLVHGLLKGFLLAGSRVTRCIGGVFTGGSDPVPPDFTFRGMVSRYREFRAPRRRSSRLRRGRDRE